MTDRCSSYGIGRMLVLAFVVMGVLVAQAAPAEARHKIDLASGLASDFQFYELAKEILEEELDRAVRENDQSYRTRAAFALNNVLLMEADSAMRRGESERAASLRREATSVIEEHAGDAGAQVQMNQANAKMQNARSLVRAADATTDFEERQSLRQEAIKEFKEAWEDFHGIVSDLLPDYQLGKIEPGDERVAVLRSSWYHWAEASYELAKLGEGNVTYKDPTSFTGEEQRTETYLDHVDRQMTELQFEFDRTFVAFYAILLVGDAYVLGGQYGLALGQYRTILRVVPRVYEVAPGETPPPGAQDALDELRLNAYQKTAQAYLEMGDDRNVVETVDEMVADYPGSLNASQIKLGRLLKAEALARLILSGERSGTLEEVIAAVDPLATDPQAYFRFRYNQMLANLGLSPQLDLETRLRCARAAMGIAMLNEAAQIYRRILEELRVYGPEDPRTGRPEIDREATQRNFEAYAPEAYWNIAAALYGQGRNMEAAMVYYQGSLLFTYFHSRFAEVEQLPEHMLTEEGTPRFDRFETMQQVRQFAVDLARRATASLTDWHPLQEELDRFQIPEAVEPLWLEGHLRWGGRRLNIGEHGQLYMETYQEGGGGIHVRLVREAFRYQQRQREVGGDEFMVAITLLGYVEPTVGSRTWNSTNNMLAELMRREYRTRVDRRLEDGRHGDPFPEGDEYNLDFPEAIEELDLQFDAGVAFYEHERSRIGRILGMLPSAQRAELEQMLDLIIRFEQDPQTQRQQAGSRALIWGEDLPRDVRLLYWYKTRYFHLRFLYAVLAQDRNEIEQLDPQAFEGSLGRLLRVWGEVQQEQLDNARSDTDRLRIRDLVNLVAERVYRYGVLLRNNPWAESRNDENGYLHERPEAVEFSADFRNRALNVWSNYHRNYRIGFEFPEAEEEERHERAQRLFDQQVRGLLHMAFYEHLRMNNPSGSEEVFEEFERVYPRSVRAEDAQLERWHDEFVSRLNAMFSQVRRHASRRLADLVREELNPVISRLRRDGEILLDDVRSAIRNGALLVRVERRRGVPVVLMNHREVKIAYLAALAERASGRAYRTQQGAIDELELMRFVVRNLELLEEEGILTDQGAVEEHLAALHRIGNPRSDEYKAYLESEVRPFLLEQLAGHRNRIGEERFIDGLKVHERDRIYRDREDLMRLIEEGSPLEIDGELRLNIQELDDFADPMQRRIEQLANEALQGDHEAKIGEIYRLLEDHFIHFERNPHVTFEAQGSGELEIQATTFSRGDLGAYTLFYRLGDGDWQQQTGELTASSEVLGSRSDNPERNRYADRHSISLRSGQEVTIVLRSEDFMGQLQLEHPDGEEETIRSELGQFVYEIRAAERTHHPRILQMHTGHIKRVLSARFMLADRMRDVGLAYNRLRAEMNRRALPYTFQVMGDDERELREKGFFELFDVGRRAFQAEHWAEAIRFIEVGIDRLDEQQGFRNFDDPPALDDDSLPELRSLQQEIPLRWQLGHAHMQQGLREGGYHPDSEHWQLAQEHLLRLHNLIRHTNDLRRRGRSGFVYMRQFENYYFNILDDLVMLYTAIGRYHEGRRDMAEAREYLDDVRRVHALGVTQAQRYSPRQRMNRYKAYRVWYEIGKLEDSSESNDAIRRVWRDLRRIYQGRHPRDIVLDGDRDYNSAMDRLYHDVLDLALERELEIELPLWKQLDTGEH